MKTNIKKRIAILLSMMILVVSLSGCSPSFDILWSVLFSNMYSSFFTDMTEPVETDLTVAVTEAPTSSLIDSNPDNWNDPGDGQVNYIYVDRWYLFGNLSSQSLVIHNNNTWEIRNAMNDDGSGGAIVCEGYYMVTEDNSPILYENNGSEVGFAALTDDILILVLTMDYEWLFDSSLYTELFFGRECNSMFVEDQPFEGNTSYEAEYAGYWMYENGYVLQIAIDEWILYDNSGTVVGGGLVTYSEDMAHLMNADGSSGGGSVYFDENNNLIDLGEVLTYWPYFPYE